MPYPIFPRLYTISMNRFLDRLVNVLLYPCSPAQPTLADVKQGPLPPPPPPRYIHNFEGWGKGVVYTDGVMEGTTYSCKFLYIIMTQILIVSWLFVASFCGRGLHPQCTSAAQTGCISYWCGRLEGEQFSSVVGLAFAD